MNQQIGENVPRIYFLINLYMKECCKTQWGSNLQPTAVQPTAVHKPALVAQLDAPSDWRPGGRGFNPSRGRQHSFVEIDHEIFSTVILSLPLIQEG